MRNSPSLVLVTLAFALAACGDDGGSGAIDASTIDSPPGAIDAAIDGPAGGGTLGAPCTGAGQGNCATGFTCLNLNGASGTWCSKPCTDATDPSCETGYTGVGFPACYLSVTPMGGGAPQKFCLIICDDPPGAPNVCPNGQAQCNGTCPNPLMCTANLVNAQMQVVAKACK